MKYCQAEELKDVIRDFLIKQTDMDAKSGNLLTSEEHYVRRSLDIAFEHLRKRNNEAMDFRYGPYYKFMTYLEEHNRYTAMYRIYFRVLALYAHLLSFMCGFRSKKIRKELWSLSLPGSIWYLHDSGRMFPCICAYPPSSQFSSYFEIGIFGKHFVRDLKLVDSVMPWLREEVKVQRFELEKKRKIHAIKVASGIL